MRFWPEEPTEEKEDNDEKGMSDFLSDCIVGQLDFNELRTHTPCSSYRP